MVPGFHIVFWFLIAACVAPIAFHQSAIALNDFGYPAAAVWVDHVRFNVGFFVPLLAAACTTTIIVVRRSRRRNTCAE
jgi:hypothetical protein